MIQSVILAGGRGDRLKPFTLNKPKCMVEVAGKPLLEYQLNWLQLNGVNEVVISCGYLHEQIKEYFGQGAGFGVHINYAVESEALGRGGGLKLALQQISPKGPVLAVNGDSLCDLNLKDLVEFHVANHPLATLVTVPFRCPYGIVDAESDGTIVGFTEKPELPYKVNAGIYVLDYGIVADLPDKGDHETVTFPKLAAEGKLKAYSTQCFWKTVDTVKDLSELQMELPAQPIFAGIRK